nr:MAG TPA: hypothetical protein [Caudoviricetes sp.]
MVFNHTCNSLIKIVLCKLHGSAFEGHSLSYKIF